jgi:hypothetical protein
MYGSCEGHSYPVLRLVPDAVGLGLTVSTRYGSRAVGVTWMSSLGIAVFVSIYLHPLK